MKFRTQKITALMVAAIVGVSTLGSVSVMAAESTEAMAVPADQAGMVVDGDAAAADGCLLYTSPSPRDYAASRMPSSA